jgi:Xaa-Pro dipeptidase
MIARRTLLTTGGVGLAAMLAGGAALAQAVPARTVAPIGPAERKARIDKAQAAMRATGIGWLLVEPGASMIYFAGVQWSRSERLTALVIPADAAPWMVTPAFEADRLREQLGIAATVRTWEEHEDPFRVIAAALGPPGARPRPVALDETARYFIVTGLRRASPALAVVDGAGIVNACRLIKSPAEIALMQAATDITIAAYAATIPRIAAGMTGADVDRIMTGEMTARGAANAGGGAQVGLGSALPHGSKIPETIAGGSVVLMDFGCTIDGYHSDVSRTVVLGGANAAQRKTWNDVRRGQDVAFAAAQPGRSAGSVDDAVRALYVKLGYAPGYGTPGLTHRTGHGIGLDIHEPINLVHGETTPLRPGMCFSNEPGLYMPGRYGVRIEDCMVITATGPRWFSQPQADLA